MSNTDPAQQLYSLLATLTDEQEVGVFLRDLCTPAELKAMADRWRVVGLLKQGVPYRKIHELTGVGVSTVTRVARYITHGEGGYDLVYNKMQQEDEA